MNPFGRQKKMSLRVSIVVFRHIETNDS